MNDASRVAFIMACSLLAFGALAIYSWYIESVISATESGDLVLTRTKLARCQPIKQYNAIGAFLVNISCYEQKSTPGALNWTIDA